MYHGRGSLSMVYPKSSDEALITPHVVVSRCSHRKKFTLKSSHFTCSINTQERTELSTLIINTNLFVVTWYHVCRTVRKKFNLQPLLIFTWNWNIHVDDSQIGNSLNFRFNIQAIEKVGHFMTTTAFFIVTSKQNGTYRCFFYVKHKLFDLFLYY